MQPQNSLNHSMDSAKKHYSSLFFLPSFKRAILSITAICALGVSLTAYALYPSIYSVALGISLFVITVTTDFIVSKAVLRNDPIFVMRRTSAMSFYCWLLWLAFMALGAGLGFLFGSWILWVKLALIGFAAVLTLRIMVLSATSFAARWRQITSALLQPILCIALLLSFWASILRLHNTANPTIHHPIPNNQLHSRPHFPPIHRPLRKNHLWITRNVTV